MTDTLKYLQGVANQESEATRDQLEAQAKTNIEMAKEGAGELVGLPGGSALIKESLQSQSFKNGLKRAFKTGNEDLDNDINDTIDQIGESNPVDLASNLARKFIDRGKQISKQSIQRVINNVRDRVKPLEDEGDGVEGFRNPLFDESQLNMEEKAQNALSGSSNNARGESIEMQQLRNNNELMDMKPEGESDEQTAKINEDLTDPTVSEDVVDTLNPSIGDVASGLVGTASDTATEALGSAGDIAGEALGTAGDIATEALGGVLDADPITAPIGLVLGGLGIGGSLGGLLGQHAEKADLANIPVQETNFGI